MYHQFGVRIDPASVVDLQLVAAAEAIARGERMIALPSLGGAFHSSLSAVSFPEKMRMKDLRDEARKLYLPRLGGSFEIWLARPLSPTLLEYAADVRFFGRLRAELARAEDRYSAPVQAAVRRRIAEAQSASFSNEGRMSAVDGGFWSDVIDSAPSELKPRLAAARAEVVALESLPLHDRIKQRGCHGMVKEAMREALALLSSAAGGGSAATGGGDIISNYSLWRACSFVAEHDRWFFDDSAEWKEFMSAAASSARLTAKQRGIMARMLASSRPEKKEYYDDDYYEEFSVDSYNDCSYD